jgi:hypothetical protein
MVKEAGVFRDQHDWNVFVADRLRERTAWLEQHAKGSLEQERLAVLRAGVVGALGGARLGLFDEAFDVEAAAAAALRAGYRRG